MKKITFLLVFISAQLGFSQIHDAEFDKMIESEMKSASKTVNLAINPNTLNYDIIHHTLEFTVDPAVYFISGKVTTTYKALSDMTTLTFDLTSQLSVSAVMQGAVPLSFEQNSNDELVITLPSTQLAGNTATVEITYSGEPANSGFDSFMIDEHEGNPILWTLSEPYGARDWWPCKQDLNDKVDNGIDVFITAPSQYVSVSNGIEPEAPTINGGNKTTHFRHGYPIPAYLIAIAVTNYHVHTQQGGLGTVESPYFPIVNYIYPETVMGSIANLTVTPSIINFYESIIGAYPFRKEKYGQAQCGWGGGMEHTTVSFMGSFGRGLIAHEMAHQWFGDKITCGSWKDIWLNEGITEYMSGLVVESFDGNSVFTNWKNGKINSITSYPSSDSNLYLTEAQLTNVGRIFSGSITYNKGSMVTHMLRYKIGNTNFFQALNNYLSDPTLAYAYAVTPQFQAHLETTYGSSLQEFFNDWVYGKGFPTYTINASSTGVGQITVQINQTQSDPAVSFFEMPVPIRFLGSGGQQYDVFLDHTFSGQTFVINVPFSPTGILLNPNKDIVLSAGSTATLGVEDFDFSAAIQMYPNPASDVLTITVPSNIILEKVNFYNALGQKSLETNQSKINVSQLAAGMYIVNFETTNGTFHKNFIKN